MKILLTGSAGFIGFHLAHKLLLQKHSVIGIDNFNNYYSPKLKIKRNKILKTFKNYNFFKVDITNKKKLEKIFNEYKPKIVIHLAAQAGVRYSISHPEKYIDANLIAFFNILELSKNKKINHFFYASSSSVYGNQNKLPININANTNFPQSLYAASKKCNEIIAESYTSIFDFKATGFRYFTNYGDWGRPDMALYKFTEAIIKNKKISLYNYGNHKRDFTHISDSVEFMTRIIFKRLKQKQKHEIFNIASGKTINLMHMIKCIEKKLNLKAQFKVLPMQKGDVKETHGCIKKTVALTKYYPKMKFKNGVENFVDWFLENQI